MGGELDSGMDVVMVSSGLVQAEFSAGLATLQPNGARPDPSHLVGGLPQYSDTTEANLASLAAVDLSDGAGLAYFLPQHPLQSSDAGQLAGFTALGQYASAQDNVAGSSETLPFPCEDCGEAFHDGLALAVHQRRHGNGDSDGLDCGSCGQSFLFLAAFRRHHRRHVITASLTGTFYTQRSGGDNNRDCIPRNSVTCGVCGQRLDREEVRSHLTPPADPGYYSCEGCDAVFGQRCSLTRHSCSSSEGGQTLRRSSRRRTTERRPEQMPVTHEEVKQEEAPVKEEEKHYLSTSSLSPEKADLLGASRAGEPADAIERESNTTTTTTGGGGGLHCGECQMAFVSRRNLLRHREAQHSAARTRFQCEVCASHFSRLDTLVTHSVEVHRQKRQFSCTLCVRKFTQKRIVTYHLQRWHTEKSSSSRRPARRKPQRTGTEKATGNSEGDPAASGDSGSGGVKSSVVTSPSGGPSLSRVRYTCDPCQRGFETRRRYLRHRQTEHGDAAPEYACEECPASYTRIDELSRHTVVVHNQKRVHKCPRCTRMFTQRRIAEYHASGHDTKRVYLRQPKLYSCGSCRKAFATEEELAKHACRDEKTSSKTCICDICGRRISCAQALRRHRLLHSDERPAKCTSPGCSMAFVDEKGLAKHMVTHSTEKPYLCDLCGKSFAMREYLNRHSRFHTGERPFKCRVCDKSFALLDTLNRHFLIHTGEKPYACEVCARPFRQAQQLKTHMKTHMAGRSENVDVVVLELTAPSGLGLENVVDVISGQ